MSIDGMKMRLTLYVILALKERNQIQFEKPSEIL